MSRSMRTLPGLVLLAALAAAQEGPGLKAGTKKDLKAGQEAPSSRYENEELGISFPGVYGWTTTFASGSAAWTLLGTWENEDSFVWLQVRDNPYETTAELREALQREFPAGTGEPTATEPVFKEVSFKEADMKGGIGLPGFHVEAFKVEITGEGKKRERLVVVRTFFGKNRLFRVHCEARRARAKRVYDLFERAVSSLAVRAVEEQAARGIPFQSARGAYACQVPEGYTIVAVPDAWRPTDAKFESAKAGVSISIVSYAYAGILADHREEIADYYGADLKLESDDVPLLGGRGFLATLTKQDTVTLIAGTVRGGRAYRVHTSATPAKVPEARRVHESLLKTFTFPR